MKKLWTWGAALIAAGMLAMGAGDAFIAGGTEMMSYTAASADPKNPPTMDAGNTRLREKHPQSQQGVCADAIATLEGIDREAVDRLAVTSQQRRACAIFEMHCFHSPSQWGGIHNIIVYFAKIPRPTAAPAANQAQLLSSNNAMYPNTNDHIQAQV